MGRRLPKPANRRERDPTVPEAEPAQVIRPTAIPMRSRQNSLTIGIAQVSFDGEVFSEPVQAN
jgi:hypothetical protein